MTQRTQTRLAVRRRRRFHGKTAFAPVRPAALAGTPPMATRDGP
jgi:hypothetical protein